MGIRNSLIICLVLLAGCTRQSPSSLAVQNAVQGTYEVQQAIPESCMTPDLASRFEHLRADIESIQVACDAEQDRIRLSLAEWRTLAILLAVALFIVLWLK